MKSFWSTLCFRVLSWLLRRHVETEMDQWEQWRVHTKLGTRYITISAEPEKGYNEKGEPWECKPERYGWIN